MKTSEVSIVLPSSTPKGRFGAFFLAALRRHGALPVELAPITPTAWVDVRSLPVMRTFPLTDRARIDIVL